MNKGKSEGSSALLPVARLSQATKKAEENEAQRQCVVGRFVRSGFVFDRNSKEGRKRGERVVRWQPSVADEDLMVFAILIFKYNF